MTRFGDWITPPPFDKDDSPLTAFPNTTVAGIDTGFWGTTADSGLIGGPTDITTASAFWSPTDYSSVYTTAADQSGWVAGQNKNMFDALFDMIREPFPNWSWDYFVAMGVRPKLHVAYVPWFLDPTWTGIPADAVGFEIEGGLGAFCTVLALTVTRFRTWTVTDNTADRSTPILANVTGTARLRSLLNKPTGTYNPDTSTFGIPSYDMDWAGPATFDAADPIIDEVDLSTITEAVGELPGDALDLTPYLGGPPESGLFFGYASLEEFSLPTPALTPPGDETQITVNYDWNLGEAVYTVQPPRRRFIYDTALVPIQRLIRRDDHAASAGRIHPPPKSGQAGTRILGGYI